MLQGLGRRRCLGGHQDLSLYRTEKVTRGPSHCHATLVLDSPRRVRSVCVCQSRLSSHLQRGPCSCPFWTHDTGTQGLATFWDLQSCPILSPVQTPRPSSSLNTSSCLPLPTPGCLREAPPVPNLPAHPAPINRLLFSHPPGQEKWQLHPSNCSGQKAWLCP